MHVPYLFQQAKVSTWHRVTVYFLLACTCSHAYSFLPHADLYIDTCFSHEEEKIGIKRAKIGWGLNDERCFLSLLLTHIRASDRKFLCIVAKFVLLFCRTCIPMKMMAVVVVRIYIGIANREKKCLKRVDDVKKVDRIEKVSSKCYAAALYLCLSTTFPFKCNALAQRDQWEEEPKELFLFEILCPRKSVWVVRTLRVCIFTNWIWMACIFLFRLCVGNKCFSFFFWIFYAVKFSFSHALYLFRNSWIMIFMLFHVQFNRHISPSGCVGGCCHFLVLLLLHLRPAIKSLILMVIFFHISGSSIRNRNTSCGIRSFGWNGPKAIRFVDITRGCGYVATPSWWDEPSLESSQIEKYRNQVCRSVLYVNSNVKRWWCKFKWSGWIFELFSNVLIIDIHTMLLK